MNDTHVFLLIVIVGLSTYATRLLFLVSRIRLLDNKRVMAGLNSVPLTMLVALVIPYTFFVANELIVDRAEVYAMMITAIIVYKWKKTGISIIIAFLLYFLLNWLLF